ncbi:MAG: flagellar hook-associated protein FlgL [Immundisolibacteraceae bacterium]|nr:flagellar hook-associated protein FlgL [Immundisolibacteraceae bacterium]
MRIASNQFFQLNLNSLQQQEFRVRTTQLQITSGQKLLSPADDPAGATRILALEQRIASLEQYDRNNTLLENQLQIEEAAVQEMHGLLDDARALLIDANSGTHTDSDYQTFGDDMRQIRDQLFSLGNSRDANGEFMFSGTATKTQPFVFNAVTGFQYQGNQQSRSVIVAAGRELKFGDSGFDLLIDIYTGNQGITASANNANTGSGVLGAVSEAVAGGYNGDQFRIDFTAPGVYDLINVTTATTISVGNLYTPGDSISVGGITATLDGVPDTTDQFDFNPSTRQNLLTTINDLANGLEGATVANVASLTNQINRGLENVDAALERTNGIRSRVGNRLNAVDVVREANESFEIAYLTTLSEIRDLDFTEAASRLTREVNALEIAHAAFARVQNLSLFDFL